MTALTKSPFITVVMTTYESQKYLKEAIESILKQTYKNFEFIIVDNASKDKTWSILQSFLKKDKRVKLIRNIKKQNVAASINKAIKIAKGKYIARMDADDWSYLDRLEKQVDFMEKHREIVISGGAMKVCNSSLKVLAIRKYNLDDYQIRKNIFRYSPFSHPTTICRTEALKKIDMYNIYLNEADEYDLYFRIGKVGKFGNLPDVLCKYRVNKHSLSQTRTRKVELITLYTRIKAVVEYGYSMRIMDILFFIGQLITFLFIPSSIRLKLFSLWRDAKI